MLPTYQVLGKDQNTNPFTGLIQHDTRLARYRFQAEGVESAREGWLFASW